jgi:outer membrane immunogenic protein
MNIFLKAVAVVSVFATPTLVSAGEDWTGFYAGANLGYSDAKIATGGSSASDSAGGYGLHAGYNHTLASDWVIGGELSYGTAEFTFGGVSFKTDTTRLKFKAGKDIGVGLLYGVLGYARVDDSFSTEDGITYGIGAAYKATDNIVLSAELLRDSLDVSGVSVDITSMTLGLSYQF